MIPLSGPLAEYGTAFKNGVQLAEKDSREKFSNIRFLFEDNRFDPQTSLTTYKRLKARKDADLYYVWGDNSSALLAPLAEKDHLPLVAMLTDPKPVRGFKWVVRFINSYEKYADTLLRYFRIQKIKRIGVIQADDPYYTNLVQALKDQLVPGESLAVAQVVGHNEKTFGQAIVKLHGFSSQAVGVYLQPGQISEFYKQAKEFGLSVLTFGADVFESKSERRKAVGLMNGAIYAHNTVTQSFRERYIKNFGNDLQTAYAANAYEFAMMVGELFNQSTNTEPKKIIAELSSYPGREGVTGRYQLLESEFGDKYFDFPVSIKRINGENDETVLQ